MPHVRVLLRHAMTLSAPPDRVFPLLCPTREYDWIEPWRCELLYSDSGVAELDCVFRTSFPDDGPPDTWVVSRYQPPSVIEFIRVNALRVIRYTIALRKTEGGRTEAEWTQLLTGLSAEGDDRVRAADRQAYTRKMLLLQTMLNHYLVTGTILPLAEAVKSGETRQTEG
jgi:hypothetical protein